MNKNIILKELQNILKEDLSSIIYGSKPSSFSNNKKLFKKLKLKYPNILLSIKHLIEISKNKDSIDKCFNLYFCKCGNEKSLTSKFCSNHKCPVKNESVSLNCKKTKLEKYGDENYNNPAKNKETCIKRYGVDNIYKSDKFKEHSKRIKLEKYGDEKFTNRQKARLTCLEKYGNENYMSSQDFKDKSKEYYQKNYNKDYFVETNEFQEKRINTCNKKYNIDSFSKTNEFKQKCKETWINNYGVEHPMKSEVIKNKLKETMYEHWGDYFSSTKYFKDLYKNKEFIKNIKDKEYLTKKNNRTLQKDLFKNDDYYNKWLDNFKQTMIERYGKPFFTQTQEYKDLYKNKEWVEEKVIKGQNTKKNNGTVNTSEPENRIYELLKTKFKDVIRWYKDNNRYPFECDFYIKSLDLFIELNFHWTHGGVPFDKNNENHKTLVNYWLEKSKEVYTKNDIKGKNKEYYTKAIYVWTELDPLKLKVFKDNKLNYKIFYNEKEFKEWFENI